MRRVDQGALALGLASVVALLSPGVVAAQQAGRGSSVQVEVIEPFGEHTTPSDHWFPLRVRLGNPTQTATRGEVVVGSRYALFGNPPLYQRALVELPAGATRDLVVPYYLDGRFSHGSVPIIYRPERGEEVRSEIGASAQRLLMLVEMPPMGLAIEQARSSGLIYDIDIARLETPSGAGDLRLPDNALDMGVASTIAVSSRVLDRATPRQLTALADWVSQGGSLVLYARDEADIRRPWVADWIGEVEVLERVFVPLTVEPGLERPVDENGEPLMVATTLGLRLECGERREAGGCSQPLGHGRVYLAGYDPSEWTDAHDPQVLDLASCDRSQESHTLGYARRALDSGIPEAMIRALDPNTGFTPALGLVAFVLLAYLIFVGPLNFRFVQKRNKPMLALITTPLIAFGCLVVLFGVGFIGKGVQARYRSFEVVDLPEGYARGVSWRFLGLYSTSPRTYDLRFDRETRARWLPGSPGTRPTRRMAGDEHVLAGISSGLWETRFVHETRFVEMGAVHIDWHSGLPRWVRNETDSRLEGAIVVVNSQVYALGDLPAGARVEVPSTPTTSLGSNPWENGPDRIAQLHSVMGMDADERPALRNLAMVTAERFALLNRAVLYARLPSRGGTLADHFEPDEEHRFVRVVGRAPIFPIPPAAAPADPTLGAIPPAVIEPLPSAPDGSLVPEPAGAP